MITNDKIIEIFCVIDEFCKKLDAELSKNFQIAPTHEEDKHHRRRKGRISESEIITILLCYHY